MFKHLQDIFNKCKMHVIYIAIICILLGLLGVSVEKCSNANKEYKHNIEALTDTIKYYQDKNGNLVATKLAFESDIKTLKLLNENLYNQIDSLKLKNSQVAQIIYVDGEIINQPKDTAYVIQHDTISKGFYKEFNFNNEYRQLEGNVKYANDSLGMGITKDIVKFDYTVAMDKDSRIYIKSTNPYVKYNEISGFTIPKEKSKCWYTGPSVNVGYDPIQNKPSFSIGWSVGYGLIRW